MKYKVIVYYDNMPDSEHIFSNHLEIDELINNFLAENPNIEIIDIKYQSNVALAIYEYDFRRTYDTSALIIYKESTK